MWVVFPRPIELCRSRTETRKAGFKNGGCQELGEGKMSCYLMDIEFQFCIMERVLVIGCTM